MQGSGGYAQNYRTTRYTIARIQASIPGSATRVMFRCLAIASALQTDRFLDLGFCPLKMLLCQSNMFVLFYGGSQLVVTYLN